MSSLGSIIRRQREITIDPDTGRTYTRDGLGQAVGLGGKAIEAIENGRTKTIGPAEASRFARILDVTVNEIVEAMGYRLENGNLSPQEREMVALYRRVPEAAQETFLDGCRATARGAIAMFERLMKRPRG